MPGIDLITISREFGAGGSELAAALGARLGWRVLDRGIVRAVAERLDVDEDAVAARDEHAPGILERIGTTLLRTSPELISLPPDEPLPDPEVVAAAVQEVIRAEAESPPLVVVGHATQALFAGRPGTLHLRLVAPLPSRMERIRHRAGVDDREASGLAQRVDAGRAGYMRRHFHCDWRDPLLYHLVVNTGELELGEAVEAVVRLVEARGGGVLGTASRGGGAAARG